MNLREINYQVILKHHYEYGILNVAKSRDEEVTLKRWIKHYQASSEAVNWKIRSSPRPCNRTSLGQDDNNDFTPLRGKPCRLVQEEAHLQDRPFKPVMTPAGSWVRYEVITGTRKDPWREAKQQGKLMVCAVYTVLNKTRADAGNSALLATKTYVMFQNGAKPKICFKTVCKVTPISDLPQLVKFSDDTKRKCLQMVAQWGYCLHQHSQGETGRLQLSLFQINILHAVRRSSFK